jgi:hypothetical protein
LPAWLAATVQVPAVNSVSVVPLAAHTVGVVESKATVRPDVEVATRAAGVVPRTWLPGETKVMACAPTPTANEFDTGAAAR